MQVITLARREYDAAVSERRLRCPPFTLMQGATLRLVCAVTGRQVDMAAVGGGLEHMTFAADRPIMFVDMQQITSV